MKRSVMCAVAVRGGGVPSLLLEVDASFWLFRFDDSSGVSSAAFCSLKGFSTASKCSRRGCYGLG